MYKKDVNAAMNSREKVKACLDRVRVIRSVCYGQIAEEQLVALFTLYGLTDEEEREVKKKLDDKGVRLLTEEEIQHFMINQLHKAPPGCSIKDFFKKHYFEQEYASFLELRKKDEIFALRHRELMDQLQEAIREAFSARRGKPSASICAAIRKVCKDSLHEHISPILGGKRRITSSKSKQISDLFRTWLNTFFTEQEVLSLMFEYICGTAENSENYHVLEIIAYILFYRFGLS